MTNKQEQTQYLMRMSVQVRLDGLSFFTQKINSNEVVDYGHFGFRQKVDPSGLLPEIQYIFEQEPKLSAAYKQVDVIYVNKLFTLVPQPLFDPSKLTDYLKFNTKILQTDFVAYDTIEHHEMITVYIPYTNVNNFFFDQYGAFNYHHAMSCLVTKALDESQQGDSHKALVNLHPHSFEMVVTSNKKLLLANTFDYQTKEDFIYYILFTLEQLGINPETVQLELTGSIDIMDEKYNLAYTYIRNVEISKPLSEDIPIHDYLLSTLL